MMRLGDYAFIDLFLYHLNPTQVAACHFLRTLENLGREEANSIHTRPLLEERHCYRQNKLRPIPPPGDITNPTLLSELHGRSSTPP